MEYIDFSSEIVKLVAQSYEKRIFCAFFCTLSKYFCYFQWEIDMFRLNVLYITFWDLSNGIYGFSYKWIWKSVFFEAMVKTL